LNQNILLQLASAPFDSMRDETLVPRSGFVRQLSEATGFNKLLFPTCVRIPATSPECFRAKSTLIEKTLETKPELDTIFGGVEFREGAPWSDKYVELEIKKSKRTAQQ